MVLRLEEDKFDRWLKNGSTLVFIRELSHGFTWDRMGRNKTHFEQGLMRFMQELEARQQREDFIELELEGLPSHPYKDQFTEGNVLVWCEGELGWTTWLPPVGDNNDPVSSFVFS